MKEFNIVGKRFYGIWKYNLLWAPLSPTTRTKYQVLTKWVDEAWNLFRTRLKSWKSGATGQWSEKKLFEIICNGHDIFSRLARLWRLWCFYFLRLDGFSRRRAVFKIWNFWCICRHMMNVGLKLFLVQLHILIWLLNTGPHLMQKRISVILHLLKYTRQLLFPVSYHNFLWSPPTKLQICITHSWSIWMVHMRLSGPWTISS